MIIKRQFNIRKAIPYVKYELLGAGIIAGIVYIIYDILEFQQIAIPNVLPAVLGTALAIFLGFRNSAAYARWGKQRNFGHPSAIIVASSLA